jgi:hypothetical protein
MTITVGQRQALKRKHQLACPSFLGYPLNTKARAKAAHGYWHHENTRKCEGGHAKICRALKRFGVEGSDCK